MSDDKIVPPWKFEANCPRCGEKLGLKLGKESVSVELKSDERLFCPVHGDVMSLEEARRIAVDETRDEIIKKAQELVRSRRRNFFDK